MSATTDHTLVVSGGSGGIGLEVAPAAVARGAAVTRGADVVLLARTAEPHPKLPGAVHTAVAEVQAGRGKDVAVLDSSRDPQIMDDAAVPILSRPASDGNGKCFIDSEPGRQSGVTDPSRSGGGDDPILDIFVDKS